MHRHIPLAFHDLRNKIFTVLSDGGANDSLFAAQKTPHNSKHPASSPEICTAVMGDYIVGE